VDGGVRGCLLRRATLGLPVSSLHPASPRRAHQSLAPGNQHDDRPSWRERQRGQSGHVCQCWPAWHGVEQSHPLEGSGSWCGVPLEPDPFAAPSPCDRLGHGNEPCLEHEPEQELRENAQRRPAPPAHGSCSSCCSQQGSGKDPRCPQTTPRPHGKLLRRGQPVHILVFS
jgi:hypothetical protein